MPNIATLCCTPAAHKLLARQLPALESMGGLLAGAVSIGMHQLPETSLASVEAKLQFYASTVRSRVRGSQPQAVLAHLHDLLFDQEGFTGNREDYYNPQNSYIASVLETKRGLPITLCLIYKCVAEQLGIKTWGIGLPGHFLLGVQAGEEKMLVDCFGGGRILTTDEARDQLTDQLGETPEWDERMLEPVSHRHWLTRMLQNLLNQFGAEDHYSDVAAMLEMEMLLWPDQLHLQRDLGLVLARCGLSRPASIWLDRYLQTNPNDPQLPELRQLLSVLR